MRKTICLPTITAKLLNYTAGEKVIFQKTRAEAERKMRSAIKSAMKALKRLGPVKEYCGFGNSF
jgi:hypothetical protein